MNAMPDPAMVCSVAPVEAIVRVAEYVPVFPCRRDIESIETKHGTVLRKAKSPYTLRGFQDATQDPDTIRAWWNQRPTALVGVPTGSLTGFVVLDYDSYKASPEANAWVEEHTDILMTTRCHTTLGGGRHYIFRAAPNTRYQSGTDLLLSGAVRKGIDLRAEGGYIIWWPLHGGVKQGDPVRLPTGLIDERLMQEHALEELPKFSPSKWQIDEPLVADALAFLDPHSRDSWRDWGMAIHLASGGSDSGFQLWHAWSAGELTGELPHNYSGINDCRYHWSTFRHDKDRAHTVTLGSLFAAARKNGYTGNQKQESPPTPAQILGVTAHVPVSEATTPRFMDWNALIDQRPPDRRWAIDHWLSFSPTLLAGAGGVGKSLIAQTIMTALATGRRFIDEIPEPLTVLGWMCEDDHDELWRRQLSINTYLGVTMADLVGKLFIEPRLGKENGLLVPVYGTPTWTPACQELLEQVGDHKVQAVFLDNIGQTFGCNENDRHHVTMFMNGLIGLSADPLAVVALGHPAKAANSEFSGSTAWENAVRMRWYMGKKLPDQDEAEGDEEEGVRYLAKRKTNYSVSDYRKLLFLDGVFRAAEQPGPITQRYNFTATREAAEDTVLFAIDKMTPREIYGRISPTSPQFLPKVMQDMSLTGGYSRKDLKDALNRLVMAGRVVERTVGKLSNRTDRMGVVRA